MSGSEPLPVARNFALLLAELEDGQLLKDLTEESKDLFSHLEALSTRKGGAAVKGMVTLKLSITAKDGTLELVPEIAMKSPNVSRRRSIFWRGKDGALVRSDPNQPDLPLRDVGGRGTEMRTVTN